MGLEAVEIIMEAEETFGVSIPDEAAGKMRTPADLIAFLVSVIPTVSTPECLTQQLFYRLRRALRLQLPFSDGKFEPDTLLATVLHRDQWPRVWREVRSSVGDSTWPDSVPWPDLLRPGPRTIRQLIWQLVAALPKPEEGAAWPRMRLEAEIRRTIGSVLGKKDFSLSARFVEDLGVH